MAKAESIRLQDIYHHEKLGKRFWKKVARSEASDACWEWMGTRFFQGYGSVGIIDLRTGKKRWMRTHRIAYILEYGSIPDDLFVCHKCDNVFCVRPNHLFLGTPKDNSQDRVQKGLWHSKSARGEDSPMAKLTWEIVQQIRERVASGESQRKIARELNVSKNAINQIIRHETWLTEEDHYARATGW